MPSPTRYGLPLVLNGPHERGSTRSRSWQSKIHLAFATNVWVLLPLATVSLPTCRPNSANHKPLKFTGDLTVRTSCDFTQSTGRNQAKRNANTRSEVQVPRTDCQIYQLTLHPQPINTCFDTCKKLSDKINF